IPSACLDGTKPLNEKTSVGHKNGFSASGNDPHQIFEELTLSSRTALSILWKCAREKSNAPALEAQRSAQHAKSRIGPRPIDQYHRALNALKQEGRECGVDVDHRALYGCAADEPINGFYAMLVRTRSRQAAA